MPQPTIQGPRDVLVRIQAAALNRLDLFVVGGLPHTNPTWPHIMGSDGTGIIEAVGSAVSELSPGDRVVINPGLGCRRCKACQAGELPFCREFRILGEHLPGTLAEYVVVPADNLAPAPQGFSVPEAAAFALATLTAYRMLHGRARVQPDQTVLVWGAGGGVAQAAIQIARLAGARVIATSSTAVKRKLATLLGAEWTLDHTTDDVARRVREMTGVGADIVVDSVGEATWPSSLRALRPGGTLVTCGATSGPHVALDIRKLFWFQWSLLGSTMGSDTEFKAIVELARQGELRPVIDSVVPLADAPAALAKLASGAQAGKLVIEVAP